MTAKEKAHKISTIRQKVALEKQNYTKFLKFSLALALVPLVSIWWGGVRESSKLKFQIINFVGSGGHMKTVRIALSKLGEEVKTSDVDLIWSYKYPFGEKKEELRDLKPHQKYNHFPFITYLTAKSHMTTSVVSKHIPKAFRIPGDVKELQRYSQENPDKRFVEKSIYNRGVQLKKLSEIDLEDSEKFVQEFVEDPLLIDGLVFDIGVFAVITSLDPLRLYIFDEEILVRFCLEEYHPFDPENIAKYVIQERQKNIWTVESTAKFYEETGYLKESLESHLESKGYNISSMWEQIEDIIVGTVLGTEHTIVDDVSLCFDISSILRIN